MSRALRETTGCEKTYVVQFAEHREHPHVHLPVIPRDRNLPDDQVGPRIFSRLGVPADRAVSEHRMIELAALTRSRLEAIESV